MKKKHILDLIRYHSEHNEPGFRTAAYTVAEEFRTAGDEQQAFWIEAQLSGDLGFVPQRLPATPLTDSFTRLPFDTCPLVLPKIVQRDFLHLVKAVKCKAPAHRFLFLGPSGTGKTAAAKMMGRHTDRAVRHIDLADTLADTVQETVANITHVFSDVSTEDLIVVDGLSSLTTSHKTGRPAATFRMVLDRLSPLTAVVVTADLPAEASQEWLPYFDAVVDFDRYTDADCLKAADAILLHQQTLLQRTGDAHPKLLHQLLQLNGIVPRPGTVKTLIRSALILSDPDQPTDYLRHLFEALTGTPKSTVARLTRSPSV